MNIRTAISLVKKTFAEWNADKAPRLGAALAYYAVFSIPPLILIVVGAIGLVYKGDVAGAIQQQLGALIGEETARTMMSTATEQRDNGGIMAGIVGVGLLLLGASGVFGELQDSLNTVWKVKPKAGRSLTMIVADRFLSFTMVLGIAFLLLVSLIISTAIAGIGGALGGWLPGGEIAGHVLEVSISLAVVTILFAMMFKFLPDVKLAWNDVLIGAGATAVLFTGGKLAIGLYLGKAAVASGYGAAGSVIVMIVWVYYSAQIFLFGAEFTRVYADHCGSRVIRAETFEPATQEDRPAAGLTPESAELNRASVPRDASAPLSLGPAAFALLTVGFLLGRRTHARREEDESS